ncbi:MAG: hypothetical protein HDQ93_00355 [Desulfovibrio sp.]|nr:hypothetical protein [Desulfovibrio sp.]
MEKRRDKRWPYFLLRGNMLTTKTIFILFIWVFLYNTLAYSSTYSFDNTNNLLLLDNELYEINSSGKLEKVAEDTDTETSIMNGAMAFGFIKQGAKIIPWVWNWLWRRLSAFEFMRNIRKFIFPRNISQFEKNIIKESLLKKSYGRRVGQRDKIISKYKICRDKTSCQSMKVGGAPFDNSCNPINLHHVAQEEDGLLLELTAEEHSKNYAYLHNHSNVSEINRSSFERWKRDYWKLRAIDFCK